MEKMNFIIIPRIIYNSKDLSDGDKLLLGLIISLSKKENYCYATNSTLANELNKKVRTISNSISKLKKCGFISIEYTKTQRHIFVNDQRLSS